MCVFAGYKEGKCALLQNAWNESVHFSRMSDITLNLNTSVFSKPKSRMFQVVNLKLRVVLWPKRLKPESLMMQVHFK
jgi:hypothetical protein